MSGMALGATDSVQPPAMDLGSKMLSQHQEFAPKIMLSLWHVSVITQRLLFVKLSSNMNFLRALFTFTRRLLTRCLKVRFVKKLSDLSDLDPETRHVESPFLQQVQVARPDLALL